MAADNKGKTIAVKRKATRRKKTVIANQALNPRWYTPRRGPAVVHKIFISYDELRELVTTQLGNKLDNNFGFYIADDAYYCPPVADAREIIKNSRLEKNTWVEEVFDCDDFAHVLKGHFAEAAYKNGVRRKAHCFGLVWGMLPEPHAINWMVNADKRLRFIEPQSDEVYFPRADDREIYFMLV